MCRHGTVRAHLTRAAREPRLLPNIRDAFHLQGGPDVKVADYALDSPPPPAAAIAKERNALADLLYLRCKSRAGPPRGESRLILSLPLQGSMVSACDGPCPDQHIPRLPIQALCPCLR